VENDPVNAVDPSGLFLENPEAAVGLGILTAALAGGAEIANAPGPCDKTYASHGPVPLALGTATGVAGGLIWGKVIAPFLGKVLGQFIGSSAAEGMAPELGAVNRLPLGPGAANADEFLPRVLQSGGKTLKSSTLRALNLTKQQAQRAIEALKGESGLPKSFHGKIMSNGDVLNPDNGDLIGNIFDYLD